MVSQRLVNVKLLCNVSKAVPRMARRVAISNLVDVNTSHRSDTFGSQMAKRRTPAAMISVRSIDLGRLKTVTSGLAICCIGEGSVRLPRGRPTNVTSYSITASIRS